ncbi:acetoacetate-CoA ligase [Gloeopeniophorella convolvens]|nr:acetoacetate-CoA ligase [Gloeopeniophorella convolvens]
MTVDAFANSRLLWKHPAPHRTRVEALRLLINRKHGLHLKDFHDLHEYSITDYTFWLDLWEFLGIISSVPPSKIFEQGYIKEVPRWFPGARLNYAENMLWRKDDGLAITESGELGRVNSLSYRELREKVRELASALKAHDLKAGDRVAAIISNRAIAVIIALATASLGGIFTSTATDMGVKGILDRYRQVQPKFIFSETEVVYAGKDVNLIPKLTEVVDDLSSKGLGHVILIPSAKTGREVSQDAVKRIAFSTPLSAFLANDDGRPLTFEQLPFDHPLFILYSSGTTGPPKCIVHSGAGVLMQTKKEQALHVDIGIDDTYFQYTTTAWMMWPYMLTGLASGARIILYDGSPFFPDVKEFLKFINEQNVSIFGTSPRFLSEVQGRGILPRRDIGGFEALRIIASTGAVLTAPQFEWAQHAFNDRAAVTSGSGGTDICAAFVSASPTLPTYAGETGCKVLGMAVEIFDEEGKDISATGVPGELVCTRPHPSLPVCFWGDDARGSKFLKAYYDVYPGVWRHGDFIAMNPRTKGYLIFGRSDGVLNPSGIRFGSGEIYGVLERSEFASRIDDAICVGQRRPQDKDERVFLFMKMRAGHKLGRAFERAIRTAIKDALSARHVPAYIFEVPEIPYTVNGKKIEIAVKQIISGIRVVPSATVANPEALEHYYQYQDVEKLSHSKGRGRAKL